jgi:hypothetical protein
MRVNGWKITKTKNGYEVSAKKEITISFSDYGDAYRYATERRPK